MKTSLFSISVATLLALSSITAKAADDGLVYVAVDPCRIVDTRGAGGAITANAFRDFMVSGNLSGQGGTSCSPPRAGTPSAISAYVIAVPPGANSGSGVLTAYPAGNPVPPAGSGSTVNYAAGQTQGVGNTTTITLSSGAEFAILARTTSQHVIVDVQGYFYPAAGSCSADMVAAGSVCVDMFEASVWDTPLADGTQYGIDGAADYPCPGSGTGCGASEVNPIYAISIKGPNPSTGVTWYQAQQACANVGKRLATTSEWQMAASGTPSGPLSGCNFSGAATGTGTNACESSVSAFDMIGNAWEWTAELELGGNISTTNNGDVRAIGDGFDDTGDNSIRALQVLGPQDTDVAIGFRCAR